MDIHLFAEHILHNGELSAKLHLPPLLIVGPSLKSQPPTHPALSKALQATQSRGKKIKNSLLTGANLEHDHDRIELLHAFANHELLALELFAWALLKFPEVPDAFKRGIGGIMLDEMRHCTMYCNRLKELGAAFGDLPLNNFMWKTVTQVKCIEAFTAAMSLTFEQANLDFAAHYAKLFSAAGDEKSASILKQVYDEEIGHVKHGAHWFCSWMPDDADLFSQHQALLPFPLTLARAQGLNFQTEARIAAGFNDDYIAKIRTFVSSKGRPPRVFFFNPCYELENQSVKDNFCATSTVKAIENDLASLMMFLAHKDDIVLVGEKPSESHLLNLQKSGFSLCEFARVGKDNLSDRLHISRLEPWGWSPRSAKVLKPLFPLLTDQEQVRITSLQKTRNNARPPWIGKLFAAKLREESPWPRDWVSKNIATVESIKDLDAALGKIKSLEIGPDRWVAKAPFGASGNQMHRFERNSDLTDPARGWMNNMIKVQGGLVLEPWVEKFADLSIVGEIDDNARVKIWGTTRFYTDEKGHYCGHWLGPPLAKLDAMLVRQAHQLYENESGHTTYFDRLNAAAIYVGKSLAAVGYSGPFGIDAFLYDASSWTGRPNDLSLQPLVEINTRWTMGHIANKLYRKFAARGPAKWLHLMKPALNEKGYVNFADFAAAMREEYGERFFATNDPSQATQCLSYVLF